MSFHVLVIVEALQQIRLWVWPCWHLRTVQDDQSHECLMCDQPEEPVSHDAHTLLMPQIPSPLMSLRSAGSTGSSLSGDPLTHC